MAKNIIIPLPRQLSDHNPCGHWHRFIFPSEEMGGSLVGEPLPQNCWNLAVDIDGNWVSLVANGIWPPNEIVCFSYNVSTRIWSEESPRLNNFFTSQWLSGVDSIPEGYVWFGYGADSSGSKFNPTYTNWRARAITVHRGGAGTVFDNSFPLARANSCEGKVAVSYDTTHIILLLETNTELKVYSSANGGMTYVESAPFTYTGGYITSRIVKATGNIFYAAILYGGNSIKVYRSNFISAWTLQSTLAVEAGLTRFNLNWDNGVLHILAGTKFYYSTNEGVTFTDRTALTGAFHFGADGSSDRKDLALLLPAGNKLCVDYTAATLVFEDTGLIEQVSFVDSAYTTVRNFGQYLVYAKDNPSSIRRHIAVPISFDLGRTWEVVDSPLTWFESQTSSIVGVDDPRWKFYPQPNKVLLDPQYA